MKVEERKIKRIQTHIMAGITDCDIKHQKGPFNSYSSRVLFPKRNLINSNANGMAWTG
jgi:hypothetical protein